MSYLLLALLLGLATYGLVSAGAATLVFALWAGRGRGLAGAPAARLIFALRVFPALAAGLVAAGLVVPAFLIHEPRGAREEIGPVLLGLAVAGALPLLLGVRRGLRSLLATRALVSRWQAAGKVIRLPGAPLPAFRIRSPFPVVSVAGFLRPRLYLAEQVLADLSPSELTAVLAHERAHLLSRDNLKAFLLRSCPDWLGLLPLGRALESAWLEAAEQAADDRSAGADRLRALDLAAALVKTARLTPPGVRLDALPASALSGGTLTLRVERLAGHAPATAAPASGLTWTVLGASIAILAASAMVPGLKAPLYLLIEELVRAARWT